MRVAGHILRHSVRTSVTQEKLKMKPLVFHIDSSHLTYAFFSDASRTPPKGGVLGKSHWKGTLRNTQELVEQLYLFSGLGTPPTTE